MTATRDDDVNFVMGVLFGLFPDWASDATPEETALWRDNLSQFDRETATGAVRGHRIKSRWAKPVLADVLAMAAEAVRAKGLATDDKSREWREHVSQCMAERQVRIDRLCAEPQADLVACVDRAVRMGLARPPSMDPRSWSPSMTGFACAMLDDPSACWKVDNPNPLSPLAAGGVS